MFHIEFGPPSVDCLCVCLRYVLNGGMSSLGHGHWMMGGGRCEDMNYMYKQVQDCSPPDALWVWWTKPLPSPS